ncbi:putative inorganic phosphate transporter 1-3 [Quercus suber]|uniref:Inorganic phosphate transporter 1-3 n=1 Tax=Quercus suber TaxID=58331 RepID=A0AAW0LTG1_QUESU|nr:inorganic phosphate transporter 1-11 [Quercus suber]
MALEVLEALDSVRTQLNHITAIIIARMGFFTNTYNIFYISTISKLMGFLYYTVTSVALIGTLTGHLFFGWIGDKLGRKKAYSISLTLTFICVRCSGLSLDASKETIVKKLCFFRFWLGLGIGGDYPISAVIMSGHSNKKISGVVIATVYAMQGVRIIFAGLVPMMLSGIFLHFYPTASFKDDPIVSTQPEADYLWRIVIMLGVLAFFMLWDSIILIVLSI